MSVKVMRDSFNLAADGAATCQKAFLTYTYAMDSDLVMRQYQIMMFHGSRASGEPFEIVSRPFLGDENVADVAAETARKLIAPKKSGKQKP